MPKHHYPSCSDRMCGALDCPRCYPLTYRDAIDDDRAEPSDEFDNEPPDDDPHIPTTIQDAFFP